MKPNGQIGSPGSPFRPSITLLQTNQHEFSILVILDGGEGELRVLEEGVFVIRAAARQLRPHPRSLEGILEEVPFEGDEGLAQGHNSTTAQ